MNITSQQKKQLKAHAHHLNPVVIIGSQGLTAAVNKEMDRALTDHELIKIRIHHSDRTYKKELIDAICQEHQAAFVQAIGHIIVIYRPSEKNK
jgi:RNA-binding protein